MLSKDLMTNKTQYNETPISLEDRMRVASHEIKNPIAALLLNFNLATRQNGSGSLTQQQIYNLVRRIKDLTEFFFDSGYLESGRITAHLEFLDLSRVVGDLVKQHLSLALDSGVVMTFRAHDSIFGQFDRHLIEQLVANLISNAIKYGKKKPVEVMTSFSGRGKAMISVQDQGEGISPSTMGRIFEFGSRDKCIAKVYEGQGLGLWIAHQIVKALGGDISVSSRMGEGSRFSVHLPLRQLAPLR